jgi:hypothetical protein
MLTVGISIALAIVSPIVWICNVIFVKRDKNNVTSIWESSNVKFLFVVIPTALWLITLFSRPHKVHYSIFISYI